MLQNLIINETRSYCKVMQEYMRRMRVTHGVVRAQAVGQGSGLAENADNLRHNVNCYKNKTGRANPGQ